MLQTLDTKKSRILKRFFPPYQNEAESDGNKCCLFYENLLILVDVIEVLVNAFWSIALSWDLDLF